jgi:hypothetical protein
MFQARGKRGHCAHQERMRKLHFLMGWRVDRCGESQAEIGTCRGCKAKPGTWMLPGGQRGVGHRKNHSADQTFIVCQPVPELSR